MYGYGKLPAEGFLRLRQIIGTRDNPGPIPVSRAYWYQLLAAGAVPPPVKIGPRMVVWDVADIRELLDLLRSNMSFEDLHGHWTPPTKNRSATNTIRAVGS